MILISTFICIVTKMCAIVTAYCTAKFELMCDVRLVPQMHLNSLFQYHLSLQKFVLLIIILSKPLCLKALPIF